MRKGSFQAGINQFKAENKALVTRNVRKVLLAGLSGCISRSPVDTGSFRLEWNVQAKSPDTTVKEDVAAIGGKSPRTATEAELSPARDAKFDIGDKIFISNALPQSNRIESGWSKQAPGGVVAPTIRELESKIKGGALD